MTEVIDGEAVAADVRESLSESIETLRAAGVTPGLATVLMSDDPASETYVSMKQQDCEEVGIDGIHVEIDPEAPAAELYETVEELNADDDVHGILVQMPVPDHVDDRRVLRAIDPVKDVDGFHPANVGRLVAGNDRYRPCTPPLANLLLQKRDDGNATVTVCHSRTDDLAERTRRADIIVAAAGRPEFIDGEMVGEGATVVDVGINRVDVDTEKGYELVGDVDYEAARQKADHITPVPGGVGPMTRAMLLYNAVKAAGLQTDIDIELP
ncbi:bifunctional 5,10-methylene-tetrahydrofolate dehydrogenase/5,10-methylene-tetrahydrofolate cyclohydrolase [Halobacteriales archaeon QS_8_69_73]|nr:MAG: bifunctional 5,10-methylene-tetrahydrofolate dehydrogenase/5,10-methylene-tetrahydrofolate cyclohydrolase [Halobacteriales archaeon QS_8_69_73]